MLFRTKPSAGFMGVNMTDPVPLVSIGLTCYNAHETILRALNSALNQDWKNIEVIVVDDMSSDGSADLVANVISDEPRARLIRHDTNMGPAGARQSILEVAKGEFLAFFDDDDESAPERIRIQLDRLENYERASGAALVACYASGERRYDNGYVVELEAIGSQSGAEPHGPSVADYLLLYRRNPDWFYGVGTPTCALFARRRTFEKVGGFDARLRRVEDADFAIRLGLLGGHFIGTQEKLFVQHATSAEDKSPEKNLEAENFLAEKHRAYLDSIGGYYYAVHWQKLRYWHFKRRYAMFLIELIGLLIHRPVYTVKHLLDTGPRRLKHEINMKRKA